MAKVDGKDTARAVTSAVKGGEGAVLGVRMLRYSGVQALALAGSSVVHLVTLFVIAHYLGASDLGQFAILYFGANLLLQILTIAVKPGTIHRTFGVDDDEGGGDDDDDDEDISASPRRSLGTGLVMALLFAGVGCAAAIVLREPIAAGLLGSSEDANLIVLAVLLGGASLIYRVSSIVLWFERRPGAFLVCELARPAVALAFILPLLAGGGGLEAVLAATAGGAGVAGALGLFMLRHSFEPSLDPREVKAILRRGMFRAPIMSSFWTISNVDIFILSRFVSDADLGIYTLASRVGFIAAFAPQGFRVALRPLRKASIYKSVEDQYGKAEHRGQLLGYFVLVCISAVLAMVLAAPTAVAIAPDSFADARALIPLAAAGMIMPALLRTVNQQTTWPGRTKFSLIFAAVTGAVVFVGATVLLAPAIDVYAAPVSMLLGMGPPSAFLFVRCQRSKGRIGFPYRRVAGALLLATAIGGAFVALPDFGSVANAGLAVAFGGVYVALLFVFGAVPRMHWTALSHMAKSLRSGRPDAFKVRKGLRGLDSDEREALRSAVVASWAARAKEGVERENGAGEKADEALVASLRRAANRGGVPVAKHSPLDAGIGSYLFSAEPTAVRNARMRDLLTKGAESGDLRALEDIVAHLAVVPDKGWSFPGQDDGTAGG